MSIGPTVPYTEVTLDSSSTLSPSLPSPTRSKARPVSEYIPRTSPQSRTSSEAVVRFKVPEHDDIDLHSKSSEGMSSYENSVADSSGSESEGEDEAEHVAAPSVVRSSRTKRASRKSTTFHLAQPAPKLRHKQRILPTRPKLFLQMQRLSPDGRPRPAIDVYPSSAFAKTIVAPFLKRFPLVSRIKCELSVQDVLLVRAEDYSAQPSDSDSDSFEEDNIKSRDLVAVLSPLRAEDKTEIVLADGTVWVATPRRNGSYDFVSEDVYGRTITARWVRKRGITKRASLPPPPPSYAPPSSKLPNAPSLDHKYTFSIIDPNHRRHPVMATLTNSSLEILDSYTAVSQPSRHPPSSSHSDASAAFLGEAEKAPQPVEEWQRNFISISAIWVALRHGWAPAVKKSDIVSPIALHSTPSKRDSHNSVSRQEAPPKSPIKESFRVVEAPVLPKRATSTGAAYVHKRKGMVRTNTDYSTEADQVSEKGSCKAGARRAFSGDWGLRLRHHQESSLAAIINNDRPESVRHSNVRSTATSESDTTLAPAPIPCTAPAFYPATVAITEPGLEASTPNVPAMARRSAQLEPTVHTRVGIETERVKSRQHKWRNMAGGLFRKLGATSR